MQIAIGIKNKQLVIIVKVLLYALTAFMVFVGTMFNEMSYLGRFVVIVMNAFSLTLLLASLEKLAKSRGELQVIAFFSRRLTEKVAEKPEMVEAVAYLLGDVIENDESCEDEKCPVHSKAKK